MTLEARRLIDQVLAADQPCVGAVFCSYTFDPAYFEEQVLRVLLRLSADPDEDAARFHEERARSCARPRWRASSTPACGAADGGSPTICT